MNLPVEFFMAWRYLKPRRDAVSVITLISVVGVSLGVCVLMVVIAIMTGFTDEMKVKLLETTPHIQIRDYAAGYIAKPKEVADIVKACGAEASAVLEGPVLIQKGNRVLAKAALGIEPGAERQSEAIRKSVKEGRFSLESGEAMISYVTQRELGVGVGDKIVIHSPSKLSKMVKFDKGGKVEKSENGELYLPDEFTVAGVFSMGKYDFDSKVIVIGLDDADELFGYPWGTASMISVKSKDPFEIEALERKLMAALPMNYSVASWKRVNSQLLDVLAVEKNMMFFLMIFIVLVAAFSIANTLITVVVQKTREIGVLRAIGADSGTVMRVFVFQGFTVGVAGTAVGMILGAVVIHWRMGILLTLSKLFQIEIFPKQIYFFNELPASVVPLDLVIIAVSSVLLCTLGGILPALRAAHLDPAKALRYE